MASNKVTVRFPVVRDGETVSNREVQVSKVLADAQLSKKPRHPRWQGAEVVAKAATKKEA